MRVYVAMLAELRVSWDGGLARRLAGRVAGSLAGWMDGWLAGWKAGWMDGWLGRWVGEGEMHLWRHFRCTLAGME